MTARNVLKDALGRFGRGAGMERKAGAWYHRSDEVVAVADLQESEYGRQYYFNLGFWLRALGEEAHPKTFRCHIIVRLETLMPDETDRIARLLDLDQEVADEERAEELLALLNERLRPVIERADSLAGLRAMVDDGTLAGAAIRGPAQEALAAVTR